MKTIQLFLFSTSLVFLSNNLKGQAGDTLYINSEQNKFKILSHLELVKDPGKTAGIKTVMGRFDRGAYERMTSLNAFSAGYSKANFWFRLIAKNNSTEKIDLILNTGAILDTLIVYKKQGNSGISKVTETGIDYPYSSRSIPNRNFLLPISIEPDSTVTCFLLVKNGVSTTYIPFSLSESSSYFIEENSIYLILGLFIGLFFFVVIFNLCLYAFIKEKIHLFYSFYVFASLVFLLLEYGLAYELGLKYLGSVRGLISEDLWWLTTLSLWLYVMQLFLNQKKSNSWFYLVTKCVIATAITRILFLLIFLNFAGHFYVRIYSFVAGVDMVIFFGAFIVLFGGVIEKIKQGFTPAKVYLVANSFGAIGAFYLFSNSIGLTNFAPVFPNVMTIGLTIEIIILTLALSYRYYYLKKEKSMLMVRLDRQQNEISKQLIQVQEQEQKRIAADLHDELGGNLAAIKMNILSMPLAEEKISVIVNLIDLASNNARNISHDLMPPEFENTKLNDLLLAYFDKLNKNGKTHFSFHTSDAGSQFDKQEDLMIYRIIMELSNNIIKHAAASEATIQLIYHDSYLELMAEDNGKGYVENSSGGIGLKNVQSRVDYLRGKLTIDSGKNGTTVIIQIPYKKITNEESY